MCENLHAAQVKGLFSWILGKENTEADLASHSMFNKNLEWTLPKHMVPALCEVFDIEPMIDAFASCFNSWFEHYYLFYPDRKVTAHNAFHQDWVKETLYLFPPFKLWSKSCKKLQTNQQTVALAIFPIWLVQPWFMPLLKLAHTSLVLLPKDTEVTNPLCSRYLSSQLSIQLGSMLFCAGPCKLGKFPKWWKSRCLTVSPNK